MSDNTSDNTSDIDEAATGLEALLARAIEQILRDEDADTFLTWMREAAPRAFPDVFEAAGDSTDAMATTLGTAIWNAVPLPGNGFRPRTLPKPARNEPCPCGSGKKYKRCCAGAPPMPPLDERIIWSHVIVDLNEDQLDELAHSRRLPPAVLGDVGRYLLDIGAPTTAALLIEPVFDARAEKLDLRYAEALDVFLDALDSLDEPDTLMEMMDDLGERLRPPLSATLWYKRAFVEAEDCDFEAAWESFDRFRRADPEDLNQAILEVSLLAIEGRLDETAAKAAEWRAKLDELDLDPGPLHEYLEGAAEDPESLLLKGSEAASYADVGRLRKIVAQLEAASVPSYTVEADTFDEKTQPILDALPGEEPFVRLRTPDELTELEEAWRGVFPLYGADEDDTEDTEDTEDAEDEDEDDGEAWDDEDGAEDEILCWEEETADPWLTFLEQEPAAAGSLVVLDDVRRAIDELDLPRVGLDRLLRLPLARRAEAIRAAALQPGEGRALWISEDNQPLVDLLTLGFEVRWRLADREGAWRAGEDVLALAPDDVRGLRGLLVDTYLAAGKDAEALAVAERFPDDLKPDVLYGRVLALYRLGRQDETAGALEIARQRQPLVATLLANRPPEHDMEVDNETALQAMSYVEGMGPLWEDTPGIIDWLAESGE